MTTAVTYMYEPGGFMATDDIKAFTQVLILSFAQPLAVFTSPATATKLFTFAWPTQWEPLLYAGLSILSFTAALVVRKKTQDPPAVRSLPKHIFWEELTSASDIVGSMSVPELPKSAKCRVTPALRHPFLDHLMRSQFSPTALLRFEIVKHLAGNTAKSLEFLEIRRTATALQNLAQRTYRLRLSSQIIFLGLAILLPVALFGKPLLESARSSVFTGASLAVSGTVVTALWWNLGARVQISHLVNKVKSGVNVPPQPHFKRRPAVLAGALVAAGLSIPGGLAVVQYGLLVQSASALPADLVDYGIFRLGGASLIAAGFCSLICVCLVVAELPGVRFALWLGIICALRTFLILGTGGESWMSLGWPGAAVTVWSVIALVVTMTRSSRTKALTPSRALPRERNLAKENRK
ncbi:hypothetical protein [Clavibacter sp. CFBP 8614]|uniref:hypothetical protein n=1 Tax=unclassified Clavibacter TaxID=2626594 RepID=UPI0040421C21